MSILYYTNIFKWTAGPYMDLSREQVKQKLYYIMHLFTVAPLQHLFDNIQYNS